MKRTRTKRRRGRTRRRWMMAAGLALLVLGLLPFACSSSFNWMAPQGPVAEQDLLAGRWEGTWKSEKSDMSGKLRAVIRRQEDGTYHAVFRAQVVGLLNFDQDVTLAIEKHPARWAFRGEKDLGFLRGGVYRYEGQTDGASYECRYTSSMDHGRFELKRIEETSGE